MFEALSLPSDYTKDREIIKYLMLLYPQNDQGQFTLKFSKYSF
jgi:hypothetical protein